MARSRYAHVRKGPARELADGHSYSSGWERDVARFFALLVRWGVLEGYDYEPMEFSFQGLGYKRGPFTYRPDFAIRFAPRIERKDVLECVKDILPDAREGATLWVEVKGQETSSDRSKWRRFRSITKNTLNVIKRREMKAIETVFSPFIEGWESRIRG